MQTATHSENTQAAADEVILRAEQITKIYDATIALNNVDFNVYRGKVNVLIGENGAGKSTLMKILAGAEQPTSGQLLLEGKPLEFKSPRDAASHHIGIIYQELSLFPNLSVAENIFANHERTRYGIVIDSKTQFSQTQKLMERLAQPIDPRTLVSNLRLGQQQIVEVARTLAQDVRILIMDEPTSALTNAEVDVLFTIIKELKAHGVSIVYISHKMDELQRIGDYVTVLRDSHFIAEAPIEQVDTDWIVERMIGRDLSETYTHTDHAHRKELLRVEHMTLPRPGGGFILEEVSFSLCSGEILGLYGLMGAGRTELLECLMALRPEASGTIWIEGKQVTARTVTERIQQGLAFIPEDRQREGLVQPLSVANNIVLASLQKYMQGFYLSARKEQTAVAQLIDKLGIKAASPQALITSLSGGNQQKVVVARNLLTAPKVLLMDEPTRGIDIGAKADMFKLMSQLAAEGLGIVFVSSELREVLAVADRFLVLAKGRITGEFSHDEATEQALVTASAAGYEQPIQQRGEVKDE
ncbi:MAG: sugar ABC transporter ATP-binding protein [Chloroflexi bacterium]|nr:sugar ABC transporter ATP-binding protein [Chloroflexota bacterium]